MGAKKNVKTAVGGLALGLASLLPLAGGSWAGEETFKDDVSFLQKHLKGLVILSDEDGKAQVAVAPSLQGRVLTSASDAKKGEGYGWLNRELIASGKTRPHINAYGGEDRFWIGPEGGQFSVFFAPGVPFNLDNWFTPAPLDTEAFPVVEKGRDFVKFQRAIELTNYSKTRFQLEVTREIRLLPKKRQAEDLGVKIPDSVKTVAFESVNTVKNTGKKAWLEKTGLLSAWILGMMKATASNTVVIPTQAGPEAKLGPAVHDAYFGKVPADRLAVKPGFVFFKGDGAYRSKIGVPPLRCKPFLGSYDSKKGVLTVVNFTLPFGVRTYVNSQWALQKDPYGGDVSNSYNDGPSAPGVPQLGKFYELESSSPALALKPGESSTHRHATFHFQGPKAELDKLSRALLGTGLKEIKDSLKP